MRIKNEPYRHRQAEKFISQTIIVVLFLSWCMNIAHANNTLPASKMFQGAAYQIFNRPRDQKRLFEVSERKEHDSKMVQTTPSDKLIEYVSEPLTLKENNRLLQTDKSTTTGKEKETESNVSQKLPEYKNQRGKMDRTRTWWMSSKSLEWSKRAYILTTNFFCLHRFNTKHFNK